MSAIFEQGLAVVLAHEGGFVDDPVDPGGATNWGISLRWLKSIGDYDDDGVLDGDLDGDGDVDRDDIFAMTRAQAAEFYRVHFWDRYRYGRIHAPVVAMKVFDLTVNMGSGYKARTGAHTLLQRACRANDRPLVEDGLLGPKSIRAVNECDPVALLSAVRSEAGGFYRGLIAARPQFEKYRRGWLKRAYS